MEKDGVEKYPLGVLVKENFQWVFHVENSENYYLYLELRKGSDDIRVTRVCTLRNHAGDTILDIGFYTSEKFIELCERNCSGKLLEGVEFFG
jgi:hypothetical protein